MREPLAPPVGRGAGARLVERAALLALGVAGAQAALRALWLGDGGVGSAGQLALLGAASVTLCLTALAFAPPARAGRRSLAALSLGLGWSLVPWALLADWLLVSTHHRPLGAVTFAAFALAVALPCVLGARRLLAFGRDGERGRAALRLGRALALIGAAVVLVLVLLALVDHEQVRSGLVDATSALAAMILVAAGSAARWPARAPRWAPLLCAGVWAATLWLVLTQPDVRATVKSAPIIAGVVGLVLR